MIKTNCKFYVPDFCDCIALKELYCKHETKCSFYKNKYEEKCKEEEPQKDHLKIMLDDGAKIPTRAHEDDAGLDLYSRETKIVPANSSAIFDTGVHIELPMGTVGFIKSKSGLNVIHGITSDGVIDVGYTGSVVVKLYNNSKRDYEVKAGDKISQLVILRILTPSPFVVKEFKKTDRASNGFGSTGR